MQNDELKVFRAALLREESALVFPAFDNRTAIALGQQMLASADRQGLALTIDITRCGQQLFHVALPGTVQDFDHWVRRKRETVYRLGHSSFLCAVECRLAGEDFHKDYGLDPAIFSSSGGAFPIFVRDVGLVGTAAASGLTETEDHDFIVAEITRFLNAQ